MGESLTVESLVDALAQAIRGRILTGKLEGGALLTEKEVSTFYDVARPTAKGALERLVYEGLLRRGVNKTARVPLLGLDDIRDLYYCRGFIEREVVAALAGSGRVPPAAEAALVTLRKAIDDDLGLTVIVESDIAFHRALVDALNSPRLTRAYGSVIGEAHLSMAQVQANHLLHPGVILAEHEQILLAIHNGDPKGAALCVTAHLDRACRQLSAHLQHGTDDGAGPGGRPTDKTPSPGVPPPKHNAHKSPKVSPAPRRRASVT
jgi:DNA-binding GntR family transcriptional regulator